MLVRISAISVVLIFAFFFNCSSSNTQEFNLNEYVTSIKEWQNKRLESLKRKDGWLSLAGLYWLKKGDNTFGAHPSNDIVFPKGQAPEYMGKFIVRDKTVSVRINSGIDVFSGDTLVRNLDLKSDLEEKTTILTFGTLSWYVIKRDTSIAIRLRDSENPKIINFKGIETFPVKPDWRLKAGFEKYDPPKEISIPTIMGTTTRDSSPGAIIFKIGNIKYKLDTTGKYDSERLWIIFSDGTSGIETYGAGRYLYVDNPLVNENTTFIDFNRAYNPPCAFTDFATCPFPPEQNKLNVRITAGEKYHSAELIDN
jgi:uncharacterized protein (DUF1684 family)